MCIVYLAPYYTIDPQSSSARQYFYYFLPYVVKA